MLGAASEAAWYVVGSHLRERDPALARAVDEDATARVIDKAAALLAQAPRQATTVREVATHAAHLRDLRNYGLHPRGEVEHSRELPFTETGCLALIMSTHRYLTRMLAAAKAADLPV